MKRLEIAAGLMLLVCSAKAEFRTWTADDGQTVRAEMVSRSISSVRLKKENGKTVRIPLDRLSKADREFAELSSPPTLSVEVDPNKNTLSNSVLNERGDGYTLLNFEVKVKKRDRLSYSLPLTLKLYVLGKQELAGRYIILQTVSRQFYYTEKNNVQTIKADQVVLTQTGEQRLAESDYAGYVVLVRDQRGETLLVEANNRTFEKHAEHFLGAQTGTLFSQHSFEKIK